MQGNKHVKMCHTAMDAKENFDISIDIYMYNLHPKKGRNFVTIFTIVV